MAGKAHDVEPHGLHVDLRRAGRLRGVDDRQRTHRMSHRRHACNVNGITGHVGSMRHHDSTRAGRDEPLEFVVVEHAVRIAAGMFNGHAPLSRKTIERTQHGVVLEHRRNHTVTGAHHAVDGGVECRR